MCWCPSGWPVSSAPAHDRFLLRSTLTADDFTVTITKLPKEEDVEVEGGGGGEGADLEAAKPGTVRQKRDTEKLKADLKELLERVLNDDRASP